MRQSALLYYVCKSPSSLPTEAEGRQREADPAAPPLDGTAASHTVDRWHSALAPPTGVTRRQWVVHPSRGRKERSVFIALGVKSAAAAYSSKRTIGHLDPIAALPVDSGHGYFKSHRRA